MEENKQIKGGLRELRAKPVEAIKMKYVLYARKSTEAEEKQALSIDSQVKEMLQIAEREGLEIVDIRREAHSAKESGQRPIFKEILGDIQGGRYNGVIVWHPDRLSRNAGDLGSLVDLMDQKLLIEIRTYGQRFTNSPSDKFLLMILCSQAKLENDNKSVNVKRGLRTRCEMGLWPAPAPTGYLNEKRIDRKGYVMIDPQRAPVMKKMFEKVANENWSGRKVYHWLKFEMNFRSATSNKPLTLSNIYRLLQTPFFYGSFEYPAKSGNWYTGRHEPIITRELFEKVQERLTRSEIVHERKEFAFSRIMTCGLCGSGVVADEKHKKLASGGTAHYIYYGCNRSKDLSCKCGYVREEELIKQLVALIEKVEVDEKFIKKKFDQEQARMAVFQKQFYGTKMTKSEIEYNPKQYTEHVLTEGTVEEKREMLANLKGKLMMKNKAVTIEC
ncbi:MAG: recombinase family protein [Candidatus Taylorbacteria bacterium]|nr:recombinase family protein [Candidatus Taylorbacteria bacterium]